MVICLSVLSEDYTHTNKVSMSLVWFSLGSIIQSWKFRWWGCSQGQLVPCPAWSSAALKVGSGCFGPPPVQLENLPRRSSAVTACPKAQSLWDFFLVLLLWIVTTVLLLCVLKKHGLCSWLYSPLDGSMDIVTHPACFLGLAERAWRLHHSLSAACCSPTVVLLAFLQLYGA